MVDSQIEAYSLSSIRSQLLDELVNEGYIKENQKCKSGALISINDGEAVAN